MDKRLFHGHYPNFLLSLSLNFGIEHGPLKPLLISNFGRIASRIVSALWSGILESIAWISGSLSCSRGSSALNNNSADADIQLLEKVTADDKSMPLFEHMNVFFVMDDNEGCC